MSYHPLHSSGKITIRDIHREKGHCGLTEDPVSPNIYSLKELALADNAGGDGEALNTNNAQYILDRIAKTGDWVDTPYRITDWYDYNHNATGGTGSTETLTSTAFTMYNLNDYDETYGFINLDLANMTSDLHGNFMEARRNDSSNTTQPGSTSTGEVKISLGRLKTVSNGFKTQAYVHRMFAKVDTSGLSGSDPIVGVKISFSASGGTSGKKYYLIHYSLSIFNIAHWSDHLGVILSNGVEYASTMDFFLNGQGLAYFTAARDAAGDFRFGVICEDDLWPKIDWGTNLISDSDSDGDSAIHNWETDIGNPPTGSSIYMTGGYSDAERGTVFKAYISGSGIENQHEMSFVMLPYANISGWSGGSIEYTNNGYTDCKEYILGFWFKWVTYPGDKKVFGRGHVHVNGNHYGCGLMGNSMLGDWMRGWPSGWNYSMRTDTPGTPSTGQGLRFYLNYDWSDINTELLLDNIVLYKAFDSAVHTLTLTSPNATVYYES